MLAYELKFVLAILERLSAGARGQARTCILAAMRAVDAALMEVA